MLAELQGDLDTAAKLRGQAAAEIALAQLGAATNATGVGLGTLGTSQLVVKVKSLAEAAKLKVADNNSKLKASGEAEQVASGEAGSVGPDNNLPNNGKQTGSGSYSGSADEAYDAIRSSDTDVDAIAANTGIKPENIQKVKDHLFNDEHVLDRYVDYGIPAETKRFDSDIKIAEAWKRLESGNHTDADIQLLKHETAERWIERRRGSGYTESHDRASERYPAPDWWSE